MKSGLNKQDGGSENASSVRTVILGIGNELLSDEGIGVHIVKELNTMDVPPEIEIYEGGTDGFGLLNIIIDADRLIVIDSLRGGSEPGTIYKFDIEDAPSSPDLFKTSVHQIGILEVINLSSLIGKTPKTTVIGVEPKSISTGMELSQQIKEKIPRVIEIIFEELNLKAAIDT
ncbi:hydrogenase maturation protease [candidate division KSB1 bacterium]|nr:hydrogenase maturation protease [candidate division KSB1 bacterium]